MSPKAMSRCPPELINHYATDQAQGRAVCWPNLVEWSISHSGLGQSLEEETG